MAKKLAIPENTIESVLKNLGQMNLVSNEDSLWKNTQSSMHLPRESPMLPAYHANWRQQAGQDAQMGYEDSLHYTSIQSISRRDFSKLKNLILAMLEESRDLVQKSGNEDAVCLVCDLFPVGR